MTNTITIINDGKLVIINGDALNFDFDLDEKIHAMQWNGKQGEVEYKDIQKPNLVIKQLTEFKYIIDAFFVELQIKQDEADKQALIEVD